MNDILNAPYNGEIQELGLKHKTEAELFESLLSYGAEWNETERQAVTSAYVLSGIVHAGEMYKRDEPYTYHLLRVANRIPGYLHLNDPEMIIAALLHDSVEDYPGRVISQISQNKSGQPASELLLPTEPLELQQQALQQIAGRFSPRVAEMVASVTNAPKVPGRQETYDEWLARYTAKIEQAATTPAGWAIKFADWCDNGLGVIYSEHPADSEQVAHFKRKYGLALPILERRFHDPDIQAILDLKARSHVERQFIFGYQRLTT